MKQAKIMLSAIAIFAVVGGALAFKAKHSYTHILYTGTTSTLCSSTLATTTATSPNPAVYTGTAINDCPITAFTKFDQ
ncbi:MAG TPA: hypothetical protein VNS58_31050 [Puia sp.]|nr:hypothetical protein [Puia sp.]